MSLKELLEQHKALEQQLIVAREREAENVLADIVRTMKEYKISLAELMGAKDKLVEDRKPAVAAKYRDPETGATWSGRGRAPHWIVDKNRDDFLIDE
jgi:DNA-binding protein H-NS